ncbi:MAG: hypothetical protein JSS02_09925 [Planctomycetes bacterium]|nr:hypothetical protein [Planctomycetota bacterium]
MAVDTRVAEQFGQFIAQGDFASAHSLLTASARAAHSPADLQQAVERMIAKGEGPITEVTLVSECILDDWPSKQADDVGYVYVALDGKGFCEAVTVTLTREDDQIRIRTLQWGRP